MTQDTDIFDQWQLYPRNQSWHDPAEFDLDSHAELLCADEDRILGNPTNVDVLTVHSSPPKGKQIEIFHCKMQRGWLTGE